jgi:hypothetical protein
VPEATSSDVLVGEPTEPYLPTFMTDEIPVHAEPVVIEAPSGPLPAPAPPIVLPSNYQYLKRWMFLLVAFGVWCVAAAAGWGLYHWWYHSLDKTPSVFVVLVFVVVCTVGGLLIAMVPDKPVLSALAVGLMSAPLGAVAGAAVLHGLYFCDRVSRCLVGVIPY